MIKEVFNVLVGFQRNFMNPLYSYQHDIALLFEANASGSFSLV